jgi:hypothetical protein
LLSRLRYLQKEEPFGIESSSKKFSFSRYNLEEFRDS